MNTSLFAPVVATRPCACSLVAVLLPAGASLKAAPKAHRAHATTREDGRIEVRIPCTNTTKSTFYAGHDARFAGLAQTALRNGGVLLVATPNGEQEAAPMAVINAIAPNLATKVETMPVVKAKPAPAPAPVAETKVEAAPAPKPAPRKRAPKATPAAA